MSSEAKSQRITFKRARPNPIFQDWLEELYEEAQQKKSKLEPMLKEALNSLSKYPLPLKSGAECIILKGFDKKLCMFLDRRLEVYYDNIRAMPQATEMNSRGQSQIQSNSSNCIYNNSPTSSLLQQNEESRGYKKSLSSEIQTTEPSRPVSDSETVIIECHEHSQNLLVPNSHAMHSDAVSLNVNGIGKKSKKSKTYKPAHRSGSYAILITLLELSENSSKPSLTKEELIENAQKHSEESFTRPKPESFYTAWSNMTRLISKGLVVKTKIKKNEYSLTPLGVELATELLKDSRTTPTANDIIFNEGTPRVLDMNKDTAIDQSPGAFNAEVYDNIEMAAGSFDIILLIDKNETGGLSKKNDPTVAQFKKFPDLNHEYRSLKVGDFTWIARHRNSKQELVLPYVIERKRMDDLGASIKDGRFHEQKFRLRKCGLSNVIYMVEIYGSNKHVGLPVQSLLQALANTRVQDGFKVHMTDSLTNSARFLAMMTKRLTIRYKDKNLNGRNGEPRHEELMTFEYFNKASLKTKVLTVTETFIKLLLQIKGLTVEKALAITDKYSTPRSLIQAYTECNQKEGEVLLANLKYGGLSRNVGPAVSKSIYQLFSSEGTETLTD